MALGGTEKNHKADFATCISSPSKKCASKECFTTALSVYSKPMHKDNYVVLILTGLRAQKQHCVRVHQRTGVQWFKMRTLRGWGWTYGLRATRSHALIAKTDLNLIIVLEHVLRHRIFTGVTLVLNVALEVSINQCQPK